MFPFRLQKLMDLRRLARDRRRAELAQAYEAQQILTHRRDDLRAEIRQLKLEMRQAARPGAVAVDQLLKAHRYQLLLQAQLQVLQQQSGQVAKEVERRRQSLLDSEKDFRVIEKLRERLQTRNRQKMEKCQQRQLDEVALRGSLPKESDGWQP